LWLKNQRSGEFSKGWLSSWLDTHWHDENGTHCFNFWNFQQRPWTLLDYFSQTYIGIINDPLFSIEFWNLSDRTRFNVPQTLFNVPLLDKKQIENSLYKLTTGQSILKLQWGKFCHCNINIRKRIKKHRSRLNLTDYMMIKPMILFAPSQKEWT